MKRLLMLVIGCCFLVNMNVNAQVEYKPFRVDLGFGVCFTLPETTSYGRVLNTLGIMLYLEPKYAIIPQLSVGFKSEANVIWRNFYFKNYMVMQGINSYQITADYHLMQKTLRPFVGVGLGIYRIEVEPKKIIVENSKDNFGVMFRTGFDIIHFRLMLAYNLAGKDKLKNNADFVSVTICTYFGGGKKKN